jgi:hypothetical protein
VYRDHGCSTGQLAAVAAWHRAVNAGAAEQAGALCTEEVEISGARGPRTGGTGRLGLPGRHPGGSRCVGSAAREVPWSSRTRWLDPASGEPGEPVRLATAFGLVHDRISRVLCYPDTHAALRALGLSPADEVLRS